VTVDPKLESIVQQLLEKSPAKRFPTAADAARELAQLSPSAEKRAAALARIRASSARHGDRTTPSRGSLVRPRPATNPNGEAVPPGRSTSSLAAGRQPGWNPTPQPGRSVRRDTTPTPISQRPAGAYSVRGPVLRGVDYALVAASDTFARNAVVAQMPEKYAADFRDDCINVLVSYELEALDAFMDLATTLVLRDVTQWRALGHEALTELEVALCTALQPAKDISTAVRRGVHGWSRLLDFGQWHVEPHETGTTLRVTGLDPASLALRLWLVGLIEETLRRVLGPSTRVVVTRGEASYAAELICEIR
jgi:serine/threonine-protein kinase